jgi:hypothetical protein
MLDENNRKAELSYAYLHAVAAAAGFSCTYADRHLDNSGVDAEIRVNERLDPHSRYVEFTLHVQLKATSLVLPHADGKVSFPLDVGLYNRLRRTAVNIPRLLVLMTLPPESEQWLHVSPQQLVARHCAHWKCIQGKPESRNSAKVTVHFDVNKVLTPDALREIARVISLKRHTLLREDFV